MRRIPLRNIAERQFEEQITAEGWYVSKRGMPDFACYRNGEFMLVEVKAACAPYPKKEQYRLMTKLAEYGVPVYLWNSEDKQYQRFVPQNHEIRR